MKNAIAIIILLAIAAFVGADCRRIVRVQNHRAAAVVVQPVVAAVFTPIVVAVPAYQVGYSDSPDLIEEVRALRKENAALKQPQATMPPAEPKSAETKKEVAGNEHPALKILTNKCAACHDIRTSNKGGGFGFLSGVAVNKLNDRQALNIAREVFSGRMPKNAKLTDEEVGAIMDWLDTHQK